MTAFLDAPAVAIKPAGPITATFTAPSSKSYTNRALVMAALAGGRSRLRRPLHSDDTRFMTGALRALGIGIEAGDDAIEITGVGGQLRPAGSELDCGLSGTTLRFLTAVAALSPAPVTLTGQPPLLRRPIAPLADALTELGAQIEYHGQPGCAPLTVRGPLRGGYVTIDASGSSQYLTALLLVAPYAERDTTIRVTGLVSRPYIEMTLHSMAKFGVVVGRQEREVFVVPANLGYRASDYEVEYDASSAAHLLALAATTGGAVTIENAAPDTLQPDARFANYLAAMGCAVERNGSRLTVRGADVLQPVELDLNDSPDMTTPLAVVCGYAAGASRIYNIELVRGHETDRIAATATELAKLGARVEESRDELRIVEPIRHGATIHTYHDHRMAMSFAAAAARTPGIVIHEPGCVAKTFPEFWTYLAAAGCDVRALDEAGE